jgi:hypothetical protein
MIKQTFFAYSDRLLEMITLFANIERQYRRRAYIYHLIPSRKERRKSFYFVFSLSFVIDIIIDWRELIKSKIKEMTERMLNTDVNIMELGFFFLFILAICCSI